MVVSSKATYRFNTVLIKTPMAFFKEIEQTILKFLWNHKKPQMTKAILKEKKVSEESYSLS